MTHVYLVDHLRGESLNAYHEVIVSTRTLSGYNGGGDLPLYEFGASDEFFDQLRIFAKEVMPAFGQDR
jgi:hypothetical protein